MEPDLILNLARRFIDWCREGDAVESQSIELWSRLSAFYQEDGRHYHNLAHIASSLVELDATGKRSLVLEGAIWFHDVIYDPTRPDNEEASVACFESATSTWLEPETRSTIARLILATDFRLPRSDDAEEALMVDIDLAVLSSEWPIYDAYRRSVRREYGHVPDDAFREGRARVMDSFLKRPVYRTPTYENREEKARANISRELEALASGQPME